MNERRIKTLQKGSLNGKSHVIYYMQQAQRVMFNHALFRAIEVANKGHLNLKVIFVLTAYPEANFRHYTFMLEGLKEVSESLKSHNIAFEVIMGDPVEVISGACQTAQALIMDKGYLNVPRQWRARILSQVETTLRVEEVDSDLLVPVEVASDKREYGAYTIRPKIHRLAASYMDISEAVPMYHGAYLGHQVDALMDIKATLETLRVSNEVMPTKHFTGGYHEAIQRLKHFIETKANEYVDRNEPGLMITTALSPYLHFGQISSQHIIQTFNQVQGLTKEAYDALFEQIIVRRELAFNFCYYETRYDQFDHMTEPWAYATMLEHVLDHKEYIYTKEVLESAKTHDPYFNAAMEEMKRSGYMHNYMRMYWAKKIIEWMPTFKEAYETTLYLNNKYFLDGRDPNSYTGVAWVYGRHDRAWTERPIFGKLRYMNDKGLERKFDMKRYINYVDQL
jgi:deoxyribodipyrimidine photo-lyase